MDTNKSFLLGAAAGIGVAVGAYLLWRQRPLPQPHRVQLVSEQPQSDAEDDILSEQFARNIQFFGEDGQRRVREAYVVVVGLGGVGSHAAHLLLRSGVGRLRLIDFDQMTLSSLNRHATATREDVGLPKATVLARRLQEIVPEAELEPVVAMYTADAEEALLGGPRTPDFLVDAIDNVNTKVALLAACSRRGIPTLSVGGAAAKADPTRLRFVDIAESTHDALARLVRNRLKRYNGVRHGITVLLSTEKPRCGLTTTAEQAAATDWREYQTIPDFRVRSIPVLGSTPAIFGMAAASWVLCQLARQPYVSEPVFYMRRQQYETLMEELEVLERARYGRCDHIHVDAEELAYIVSNVWRGVSAHRLGIGDTKLDNALHRRTGDLCLTRFDGARPATADNLVLLTTAEADELWELGHVAWAAKYPDTAHWVAACLERLRLLFGT